MLEASRLAFDPLIPWVALWVLVAGAVALWGVYLYLRGKAWLFRALGLTILALALANPLWIQEQREPLKDIVISDVKIGQVDVEIKDDSQLKMIEQAISNFGYVASRVSRRMPELA